MPPSDGRESKSLIDPTLMMIMQRYGGRFAPQVVGALALAQTAAPAVKWAWAKLTERENFTVSIAGTDDVYTDLHEWVLSQMSENDRKALIATTARPFEGRAYHENEDVPPPTVRLLYDGSREQQVNLDGHAVTVGIKREEIPGGSARVPENWQRLIETIMFTSKTPAGRDAIIAMIARLAQAKSATPGPPPLYIPSKWGGDWNRRRDLPPRSLNSVVLKDGQLERLCDDLTTFLHSEEQYAADGQPWHRGYLFHGAPGTGKTSLARALAAEHGMPTFYLPLGDLEKDADLLALVSEVPPRSMLLLEDVDTAHATTERTDEVSKSSVAAMLNALDGIWTPHGMITVMTTNNRDALDGALIREGRIDVDEEFTELDASQATRLAEWLQRGRERHVEINPEDFAGKSPAAMIQTFRRTDEQHRTAA
jgi:hypothetical protein